MTLNLTPADAVTATRAARDLTPGDLFVFTDAQDRRHSLTVRTVGRIGTLAVGSTGNRMLSVFFSDAPAPIRSIQLPEQQQVTVQLPPLPELTGRINAAQSRAMTLRSARNRVTSALSILNEIPATTDDLVLIQSRSELTATAERLDATARAADRAAERAGDDARDAYTYAAANPAPAKPDTHRHDWIHTPPPSRQHVCCAAGCDAAEPCDHRLDAHHLTP